MSQPLGEILLAHGTIDEAQLHVALIHQRSRRRPLGDALVELQFCNNDQVLAALAAQAGLPTIDLDRETPDPKLAGLMSRETAERFQAVPLRKEERMGILAIAVAAPASQERLEELRALTKARALQVFMASDQAINRGIARLYTPRQKAQPTVLLYGWPEDVAKILMSGLIGRQIPSRIASALDAAAAGQRDILLAPIQPMEALLGGGRCRALLIAAAKRAEDFARAEKMDACGFVLAPLDMDCVQRAVERCYQILGVSPRQAA